jgi:enediyne biosynthesis protein E7
MGLNGPLPARAWERRFPQAPGEIDLRLPTGTLQRLVAANEQFGDVFSLATRGQDANTLVVAHPEAAQEVLCRHHADYRRVLLDGRMELVLGEGLLTSEGGLWKSQRKSLQRCFHGETLRSLMTHAERSNAALVTRWGAFARRGEAVELTQELVQLGIDTSFNTLFGADAATMHDVIDAAYLQRLCAPVELDTRSNLLFLKETNRIRAHIRALCGVRRTCPLPTDLLGFFAHARICNDEAMSDAQIADEIMSTMTASHETVALVLRSAWHAVANDHAMFTAIRDEVDVIVGASDVGVEHLSRLVYTKQVIQETMRLHPPAWVISRRAIRDSMIGGRHVPAGTNVLVCPYLIHRHATFWPAADRFEPLRFAPKTADGRHRYAYLPYSMGPRNCIGDALSMKQMLLHLATMVHEFDITQVEGSAEIFASEFLLRANGPMRLGLDPRRS